MFDLSSAATNPLPVTIGLQASSAIIHPEGTNGVGKSGAGLTTGTGANEGGEGLEMLTLTPQRNELLCFLIDKCKVVPFDNLSKICSDFYKEEEIFSARDTIAKYTKQRLTKRQGGTKIGKSHATVEDIIKICLNPSEQLPVFYAVDLSRLPPVDV